MLFARQIRWSLCYAKLDLCRDDWFFRWSINRNMSPSIYFGITMILLWSKYICSRSYWQKVTEIALRICQLLTLFSVRVWTLTIFEATLVFKELLSIHFRRMKNSVLCLEWIRMGNLDKDWRSYQLYIFGVKVSFCAFFPSYFHPSSTINACTCDKKQRATKLTT